MKKIILYIVAICFLSTTLAAQEIGRLKNYYTKTYLNTENGTLQASAVSTDSNSAQWEFIKAGNNAFRIKSIKDGTFLNIETDNIRSSAIEDGWLSALWTLKKIEGTNLIQISNLWRPNLYLNVEDGLVCSPIKQSWWSARWEYEVIEGQIPLIENTAVSVNTDVEVVNPNETNGGMTASNELMNIEKILAAHNSLRKEVGVPPLEWSATLAATSQAWADNLMSKSRVGNLFLKHSGAAENLLTGNWPSNPPEQRILAGWGEKEKVNFNPETRKCYSGKVCGHYTQVIWSKTTKVGCGVALNAGGEYILICQYDPAGNLNNGPAF
jgi:pathogenesis-related protein 1